MAKVLRTIKEGFWSNHFFLFTKKIFQATENGKVNAETGDAWLPMQSIHLTLRKFRVWISKIAINLPFFFKKIPKKCVQKIASWSTHFSATLKWRHDRSCIYNTLGLHIVLSHSITTTLFWCKNLQQCKFAFWTSAVLDFYQNYWWFRI